MTLYQSHRLADVWAARGGHGATTIAGAIGVFVGLPVQSHESGALDWLWPGHNKFGQAPGPRIADAGAVGRIPDRILNHGHTNIVVLRGPCTLGLKTLAPISDSFDHVILIREPWRSIHRREVETALSAGVAAEVAHSPRVARLSDAGLLGTRVGELEEFTELTQWASDQWRQPIRPLAGRKSSR